MYESSTQRSTPPAWAFLSLSLNRSRRELIIGVSVNATSSDTRMAMAIVQPNEFTYFRANPVMNAIGRKIITSERVVAITASPISFVASIEARTRSLPFSSMNRKMFSSTMMASSITIPTASVNASSVMLFSEKSIPRISVNVEMMEAGMATAAISTARQFRMDRRPDEIRNVVNHLQLHARRQLPAQFLDLVFDFIRHAHRVRAGLPQHLNAHDLLPRRALPEEFRPGAQFLRAILHLRDIPDAHRRAAARSDHDLAELFR